MGRNYYLPPASSPLSYLSVQYTTLSVKIDGYIMPHVYFRTDSCTPRAAVRVDTRAGRVTKRWRRTQLLNLSGKSVYLVLDDFGDICMNFASFNINFSTFCLNFLAFV
jgi:hypothetical protein